MPPRLKAPTPKPTAEVSPAQIAVSSPAALAQMVIIDGPDGPCPFDPWDHQREFWKAIRVARRVIILKARQLGMTWAIALYALWYVMAHPGRTCLVLSKGEREARLILRRVKRMYDSLPNVVKLAFAKGEDSSERFGIKHPEGDSAIVSLPGTGGRSETAHLLLLDEGAHWENTEERLAAVLPTAADAGTVALVSTANGEGDPFEVIWAEAPENGWTPIFIKATARPGRTEAWVEVTRATLKELGPQEYPMTPEEAFLSSGRSAFDLKDLKDIRECCEDPGWKGEFQTVDKKIKAVTVPDGGWWVWEWPVRGRNYLISADVCGGQGGSDFSVAYVFDLESWDMVAAYKGRPEPDVFARMLMRAGFIYTGPAGPALLAWESNNHGAAVTAIVRGAPGKRGYPRLYQREVFDTRERKARTELGWRTDTKTRHQLVSAAQAAIRERTVWIRDVRLPLEARRFIWRETLSGGRYEAAEGAHDDHVVAFGIGCAVLANAVRAQPPPPPAPRPRRRPVVSSLTGY